MRKYRLTEETMNIAGEILYRIEALRDFSDVKKGEKGGWIAKEENLSHDGDCWIYQDAVACENSQISENAKIYERTIVIDSAKISQNVKIFGNMAINYNVEIYGNIEISGDGWVSQDTETFVKAKLYDKLR